MTFSWLVAGQLLDYNSSVQLSDSGRTVSGFSV